MPVTEKVGMGEGMMTGHRMRYALFAVILVAALAVPATAGAVLQNEYGQKYAGHTVCTSCHPLSYGETTHGKFAQVGADPADDFMWPAGRPGVGELVYEDEVAFTLGYGTGLREYLVNNEIEAPEPEPVVYTNIEGDNRYETAVAASMEAFDSAETVVVATGESFPDAMGGAALAGAVDGPVLLTPGAYVPDVVLDEIDRLGATDIYVLGSESAVSATAFADLDAAIAGTPVRLGGANRYATAKLIADEVIDILGDGYGGGAIMATGLNFPDALASSPIMFKKGMPLVLVNASGGYTLSTDMDSVTILGSDSAVPASVELALGDMFEDRIEGDNRYETAAAIADWGVSMGMSWDGVGIATGENFPDALSGGPLLGAHNSVMLLTTTASLSSAAADKLDMHGDHIGHVFFLGGYPAISMTTRDQVKALLPGIMPPAPTDLNPFYVPSLEWDPALPETWEMGDAGIEAETYTCGNCHHLGWVTKNTKPKAGTQFASTATTPVANAWATDPAGPATSPEKYVAGSSIQCEVCHGTGQASAGVSNHFGTFTSNVKILKGTQLLESAVCGKCHASWKSGNTLGFTPDQNVSAFATQYTRSDVPTEGNFFNGTNWRFYPSGQNKGMKHVYYTEWAMSGHAYRGQYYADRSNPRATPYMLDDTGHYNPKSSTAAVGCTKCHTGEGYAVRKDLAIVDDFNIVVGASANVGYYGQECAVCHIAHNAEDSTNDNGMDVRKPDAAATKAGIVMTSICEDCHNWQLEMMGEEVPTSPEPKKDLTARGGYSHPTREIYNGKTLFEVADAGQFMPGVKCEECHMPATRSDFAAKTNLSRYADRSWKRYSHRMFIMDPTDAKTWGLARWGDSCSPCHPSSEPEDLTAAVEGWQEETAEAADAFKTAYAAAYTIAEAPEADETTASAAFKALMGRGYYNYRSYAGEGSMGAHNPEYLTAGLEVGTKMAKSVNGGFAYADMGSAYGSLYYIAGRVLNGDGSGAAGAKIVAMINDEAVTFTADANGNFVVMWDDADSLGTITWKRCSDPVADLSLPS